ITETTFGAQDAEEIYIGIESLLLFEDENSGSVLGYDFEKGDRMTFIRDKDKIYFTSFLDFRIEGLRSLGGRLYLAIKNKPGQIEFNAGDQIEVYTPGKVVEEEFFFEFGECYKIIDAKTATRRHSKGEGGVDQIVGSQPATGTFTSGDTWIRVRRMPTQDDPTFPRKYFNHVSENEFAEDNNGLSRQQCIGRPNIIDLAFRKYFYAARIRYSGSYLPESQVNFLSRHEFNTFIEDDINFGAIKKLAYVGQVLLAIHQFKIQPLYIGQREVYELDGTKSVVGSSDVANKGLPLQQDWGTHSPESVIVEHSNCYGADIFKGLVWRYASNGLFDISFYKAKKHFNDLFRALYVLPRLNTQVLGGYDRNHDEYLLTIVSTGETGKAETLSFSEKRNRWETFYSFIPQYYGRLGLDLITFSGELWLHERNPVYNNFYGVQFISVLGLLINGKVSAIKDFYTCRIASNKRWAAKDVEVLSNTAYPNGMRSRITPNNFKLLEGDWWADFRRDFTDPLIPVQAEALSRGRKLKGKVVKVTLENSDTVEVVFHHMDILMAPSMQTI
ncbi:MAG TPA: hypothetical protein VI387_06705, partial [Candidatus Brocadiales bacterium]|nr:hypothetical protein [Candidatus Brocadiales bacterium]